MAGEEGVPVWGVEFGSRRIRAARVSRRAEGGFWLLDYMEETQEVPGTDGLLAFLRRRRLWGHPLVLTLDSPSTLFRSVALSVAESSSADPRDALLEHVHPEPEQIELHSRPLSSSMHLVCSEDRARVESTLIALELADLPAYALVPGISSLFETVRRTGLFEGDGLVLHVGEAWSSLLFLDGEAVRHLALPVGSPALSDPQVREEFAADVKRLIEYHRTRAPHEGTERIVLLGMEGPEADALGSLLPARPLPFPGDAGPVRGKGRVSMHRGLSLLRLAPRAIGAAIAGAAQPRQLEIAYRRLPDTLPSPPRRAGAFIAAALVLWIAGRLTFLGIDAERRRLARALGANPASESPVAPGHADSLRRLSEAARARLAFPEAALPLLYGLPGDESAPWATESLTLRRSGDAVFEGTLEVRLVGAADPGGEARVRSATERASRADLKEVNSAEVEGSPDIRLTLRSRGEARK